MTTCRHCRDFLLDCQTGFARHWCDCKGEPINDYWADLHHQCCREVEE